MKYHLNSEKKSFIHIKKTRNVHTDMIDMRLTMGYQANGSSQTQFAKSLQHYSIFLVTKLGDPGLVPSVESVSTLTPLPKGLLFTALLSC